MVARSVRHQTAPYAGEPRREKGTLHDSGSRSSRLPLNRPTVHPCARRSTPDVYRRRWWILAVLCLALLIVGIDGTIVNVALPSFVRELGRVVERAAVDRRRVHAGLRELPAARGEPGDRFGRKPTLLVGLVIFGSGRSLPARRLAQRAHRDARRPGFRRRVHHAVDAVDPHERVPRRRARSARIGIWAGVSGLGVAIGPITGGYLLEHFWWGSIFLINVPSSSWRDAVFTRAELETRRAELDVAGRCCRSGSSRCSTASSRGRTTAGPTP